MITDYSRCFLVASLDLLCFGLSICVHDKEKKNRIIYTPVSVCHCDRYSL
jgi:hypothetical protein